MELSQQGTAVGVSGTQEHDLDDILAQFDKHEGLIIVEVLGMGSGQLKMWMDDGVMVIIIVIIASMSPKSHVCLFGYHSGLTPYHF